MSTTIEQKVNWLIEEAKTEDELVLSLILNAYMTARYSKHEDMLKKAVSKCLENEIMPIVAGKYFPLDELKDILGQTAPPPPAEPIDMNNIDTTVEFDVHASFQRALKHLQVSPSSMKGRELIERKRTYMAGMSDAVVFIRASIQHAPETAYSKFIEVVKQLKEYWSTEKY